jgi:hypothetical protein
MKRLLGFLLLASAFALATRFGWWGVPAVAALWGALRPAVRAPAAVAGLAAASGWGFWLLVDWQTGQGALGILSARLSSLMGQPLAVLFALTLLLPALLAWSAAALAGGITDLIASRSGATR